MQANYRSCERTLNAVVVITTKLSEKKLYIVFVFLLFGYSRSRNVEIIKIINVSFSDD